MMQNAHNTTIDKILKWCKLPWPGLCIVLPFALLLLAALACGGIGLAYEHDLTGDYAIWAGDLLEQAAVVKKIPDSSSASTVVNPMVFAYGWNEDFIIAKQHPNLDDFDEIDTQTTNWFIVNVKTQKVYGPMTEKEFAQRRQELGVPQELTFIRAIEP